MRVDFNDPDLSIEVSAGSDQIAVSNQRLRILGIHSESAIIAFNDCVISVKAVSDGQRLESYTQFHSHNRTAQGADKKPGSVRIIFGMMSIGETEHIAGKLQDHVLKATAGPERRDKIFASQTNGLDGA
jgi:hypothetical protein